MSPLTRLGNWLTGSGPAKDGATARRPVRTRSGSLAPTYIRYLSLRLLIFLVVLMVIIALGLRNLFGVVLALLVSGVLSYPLARRQRDDIAREIQNRRSR